VLNVNRIALVIPLILLVFCTFGGCQGSRVDTISQELGASTDSKVAQPGFGTFLPSPRALLAGQEQERSASLLEESYIKEGSKYEVGLPNNNVLPGPSNSVEFMPFWSDVNGKTAANLAYCIYRFTLPGYDRGAELRYGWAIAPPEIGTVWFGLSNWQRDRWDWVSAEEDGVSSFSSTEPYFNGSGEMYVVVVCANDDIGVMRYLRAGEMPDTVVLAVTPRYSRPPVYIVGNASGSTMPIGTIEKHEWDWDNDGIFEKDTGTSPLSTSSFDAIGDHPVSVRVTSSNSEQATASDTISVVEPWTHSWGTDLYQDVRAIETDGSEFCYSAGSIMRSAGHRDALLLKHNLGGGLAWVAAWGGEDFDALVDVKVTFDGNIFTVGQTHSYGAGGEDVLLQRWDADGNVVWSRTWGTAGLDRGAGLALTDYAVYVVGDSEAMGDTDVLLLKYSFDGNFLWARTWGGTGYDTAADIASSYLSIWTVWYVFITGSTFSPSPLHQDVLYLKFDEYAGLTTERVWRSDTDDNQYGGAIAAYDDGSNGDVYIAGSIGDIDQRKALLLELGFGTGSLARTWSNNTECVAYGVLSSAGNLYIAGRDMELGITSGGFVANFSDTGSLQNSAYWADADDNTGIGGNCKAADLGSWSGTASTVNDPGGTWSTYTGTVSTPVGSTGAPGVTAVKVTSGVEDTGGGDWDTLLSIVQFP